MARRKIIAGNWKMNKTPSEAVALINELKPLVATEDADVVFCVPAISIIPAIEAAKGRKWSIYRRDRAKYAYRCWGEICYHRTF